ncbi:hypothetical protein DICVIV_00019 [Dictyocaulus viviparus]|uniref:Uncharacterized protein n=1 Tax=Dictyocaulus viviparus TaxID=29172 RepID=A0A0D8YFZ9_DICVI|nr:hypothetical protein DICVIV_00019 [Dictyocaulus viviparus]
MDKWAAQLLLYPLIYALHENDSSGNSSTAEDTIVTSTDIIDNNSTTILTTYSTTNISTTNILRTSSKTFSYINDWQTIGIRIGVGGICAFGFVALFTCLYYWFSSGSNKRRSRRRRIKSVSLEDECQEHYLVEENDDSQIGTSGTGPTPTTPFVERKISSNTI